MVLRKFLFIDDTEGFHEEAATTDETTLGKISLTGLSGVGLDLGANKIVSLADPTSAQDAATKAYVDAQSQGLNILTPARVKTTAALSVTASGSGIGKTLTATSNGAISIDGVALSLNDRVLVDEQSGGTSVDNGVYTVTTVGDGGNPFVLTRATDFDENAEVISGSFIFVTEGAVNANCGHVLVTANPITVDTTAQTWEQFSGAGQFEAGAGLTKTGNVVDVGTGPGILVSADKIEVELSATPALEFDVGGDTGKLFPGLGSCINCDWISCNQNVTTVSINCAFCYKDE